MKNSPTAKARKFLNDVWSSANGKDWALVCADPPWVGPAGLRIGFASSGFKSVFNVISDVAFSY